MMSSVDGRIDCAMTEQIDTSNAYYDALAELRCPSQLMGRVTMQMHYAEAAPFKAKEKTPIGKESLFLATHSEGYTIAVDTHGSLRWSQIRVDGKPLLVITSEGCHAEYLHYLKGKGISWIATGKNKIDLKRAMEILAEEFAVKRLVITGGGHINGAFLEAGLIDEVSLMIGAGIDGRAGMTAVFDGIKDANRKATLLRLESVKAVNEGTVWLRYVLRKMP